jgi:hypothetical protein
MFIFLISILSLGADSSKWSFHDQSSFGDRSMITYRTLEITEKPSRSLSPDTKLPANTKFSTLSLGPGGSTRIVLAWDQEKEVIWVDTNIDGRLADEEKFKLGKAAVEVAVTIGFGDQKEKRTILIRKRSEGLASAIRGYMSGQIRLNGKNYSSILTDGNADGCFDSAAHDRIWIDLNQDNQFDPLTEQFPLGTALKYQGVSHLIASNAQGTQVTIRPRPSESGTLRATLTRLPQSKVLEVNAQFVSEWGELIAVTKLNEPISIPEGKYRIDSLSLRVKDTQGQIWNYSFTGNQKYNLKIERNKEFTYDLVDGLKVTMQLHPDRPGKEITGIRVEPNVVTESGLYLTDCWHVESLGERSNLIGRSNPVTAKLQLKAPGSEILDEIESGFN